MRILIIGGTGTIGSELTDFLRQQVCNQLYIVSKSTETVHADNIKYIHGDIFDHSFFVKVLEKGYDCIVDFMIWSPNELKNNLDTIFRNCKQYIAMGTSSAYAKTNGLIDENAKRFTDIYPDEAKQTYRYVIEKAVADDVIMHSRYQHWTIIRPWVTFNTRKHVLVTVPVSVWLWRFIHGKTIVIPRKVLRKKCSLTYAKDSARAISKLVGNDKALGEIVNVTTDKATTWAEVLELYKTVLSEKMGGWSSNRSSLIMTLFFGKICHPSLTQ